MDFFVIYTVFSTGTSINHITKQNIRSVCNGKIKPQISRRPKIGYRIRQLGAIEGTVLALSKLEKIISNFRSSVYCLQQTQ
jgi:hypothetical protein